MKPANSMNSNTNIKYKKFSDYYKKYYRNLDQQNCLIQPLNSLCGGWSLQTFKQVADKLSTNKSSPLPLFFPNAESMQLVTKNKTLREQVFNAFDTRGIKRIDATQFYCALIVVSKGPYEMFLKTIIDVFGFQYPGRIQRQQFFFFLDSFFRAVPKIVIIKNFTKPSQPNIRLDHEQIKSFIQKIFEQKQEIEHNEIYESVMRHKELSDFIRHIQKRCSGSAQKCRNQTIERISIQAQVRNWLAGQIEEIVRYFDKQRQNLFQQVLS